MKARNNIRRAKIIEQAIAIDAEKGAANAWVFLRFHAIPQHLAASVLAKAGQRRATHSAAATLAALDHAYAGDGSITP